jgi:hypothetical protein
MKLKLPPPRYRVVKDDWLGYEAQFKVWYWPWWRMCSGSTGGPGVNTSKTVERARRLCVDHLALRTGSPSHVVAQFSARSLEPNP